MYSIYRDNKNYKGGINNLEICVLVNVKDDTIVKIFTSTKRKAYERASKLLNKLNQSK